MLRRLVVGYRHPEKNVLFDLKFSRYLSELQNEIRTAKRVRTARASRSDENDREREGETNRARTTTERSSTVPKF